MKSIFTSILGILFLVPFSLMAQADLVSDFNQGSTDAFSDWNNSVGILGDKIFMAVNNGESGEELGMIHNGNLSLLKDITPGESYAAPNNFTVYKGKMYFTIYNNDNNAQLWVTEGTEETTQLVFEPNTGGYDIGSLIISKNNVLFFSHNFSLYKFDGNQVAMVTDQSYQSSHDLNASNGFCRYNQGIAYLAYSDNNVLGIHYTEGQEVEVLAEFEVGSGSGEFYGMSQTQGGLVFAVKDFFGTQTGQYFYDESTHLIEEMKSNGSFWDVWRHLEFDDEKDVILDKDGYHVLSGNEHDMITHEGPSFVVQAEEIAYAQYEDNMVFCARRGTSGGEMVYRTDGSWTGTDLLFETSMNGPQNMIMNGSNAYFSVGDFNPEIWEINLENNESRMVYSNEEFSSRDGAYLFGVIDNHLYFRSASNSDVGLELYRINLDYSTNTDDLSLIKDMNIQLYSNGFKVNNEKSENVQVELYNQLGQRIFSKKSQTNVRETLEDINGLHFIKFTINDSTKTLSHFFK